MNVLVLPLGATQAAQNIAAQANGGRPDLNHVLTDYQAPDDKVVDYRPKFWGEFTVPFSDSVKMTGTEGDLLDNLTRDRGFMGLSEFRDIKDQAFDVSKARYPVPSNIPPYAGTTAHDRATWVSNDGHRDAFRHAYWNALLTKNFGENWTRQFATAHEGLPGNPADREAMDLYNNEVGRQIAVANPNATDEELANLVQKAVTDGKMVVIDGAGNLEWSDRVAYGQHGIANDAPAAGGRLVPDGTASAN